MLLTGIVFFPLFIAVLLGLVAPSKQLKSIALLGSLVELLLCFVMLAFFETETAHLQMAEQMSWIPSLGISYFLGVDGISLWLVMLTGLLQPLVILGSWNFAQKSLRSYYFLLFALQTSMLGTFLAMDGILFYIFFESSLVPMYFLIGLFGGSRRIYSAIKLFIFTMTGSLFLLGGLIALMFLTKSNGPISASLLDFYNLSLPFVAGEFFNTQTILFFAFVLAFAVKVPLLPLHTWLPDAHVEAPTSGSVILAGVMLKMGAYGFLRFVLPIFPEATQYWAWVIIVFAVLGIIYGALVAMVQTDIKKLVAYSSVSHMGYVVLGIFTLNMLGVSGGLYQMLNHGISTGALFLLVGMIYDRLHTREIDQYGGLATVAPLFSIFFLIVTFSSIALPLTNGFVGEFLILLGAFQLHWLYALFAVTGVVLGAAYMLWMVKRVFFGKVSDLYKNQTTSLDINYRECMALVPLVLLIFIMGIFPNYFLSRSQASLEHLLNRGSSYQLIASPNEQGLDKLVHESFNSTTCENKGTALCP